MCVANLLLFCLRREERKGRKALNRAEMSHHIMFLFFVITYHLNARSRSLLQRNVKPMKYFLTNKNTVQPCNPAIGGPAKSQLVHEVDALGGEIGKVADT